MKGYKTSKDYKRLKELIDKGYDVVIVEYNRFHNPITSVATIYEESRKYYFVGSAIWADYPEGGYGTFEEECEDHDIEFIEPTEEVQS